MSARTFGLLPADAFRATWRARNLGRTFVSFRLGATGKAEELAMDVGGAATK